MSKINIETETISIDLLQPHPRNVRQGDIGAISESLKAHGQYRPITYQKSTGRILAGNHTWKAAKALGWKEIVATSIVCNDEEAIRILLADNRTSDLADYDDAGLAELLKELADTTTGLEGTLFDGDALDQLLNDLGEYTPADDIENIYSQAVKVPQYEIVGDEPKTSELLDTDRTKKLQQQILKSNLPDDVRDFLIAASNRHTVFNYAKIAEFYPHQTPEIQQLMEESVLIIIDADDAIAKGYATFAQTIDQLEQLDNEDA
jgi:hypothetical protein